jgi:hypothetical protein
MRVLGSRRTNASEPAQARRSIAIAGSNQSETTPRFSTPRRSHHIPLTFTTYGKETESEDRLRYLRNNTVIRQRRLISEDAAVQSEYRFGMVAVAASRFDQRSIAFDKDQLGLRIPTPRPIL